MSLFDLPLLLTIIHKLKQTSRASILVGSGSIAAVVLVLRYILSKNVNYNSNLSKIGRSVTDNMKTEYEYDIIIVGGGIPL